MTREEIDRETPVTAREHVFHNIVLALHDKFGDAVQPDVDQLNDSYLVYIGNTTVEVTFNDR